MFRKTLLPALIVSTSLLGACGTPARIDPIEGQFWQRSNVTEAAYMQGPKAQQILNQNIASCVTELRELERLGSIKNAIPANIHTGQVYSDDEVALMTYNEPQREKYLLAEDGQYHNFESCMIHKGWERVKYVPFDIAHESRKNYLKAHVDYKYQSTHARKETKSETVDDGVYGHLND